MNCNYYSFKVTKMILIDDRTGSKELLPIIRHIGIPAELTRLEYGDVAFEGRGPKGTVAIGLERKTLGDMLACIEDARYAAHQRPGMLNLYSKSFLCMEGLWRPGEGNGYQGVLMAGYRNGQSWGPYKGRSSRQTLYSKLFRYLVSVQMSGVVLIQSINLHHTAYNIAELYQWFQKPWQKHHSLIEVQKLAIPELRGRPSLVRRWASEITDIGVVHSLEAEMAFKTGRALANADETDWVRLPGIGPKTARQIVAEINNFGRFSKR